MENNIAYICNGLNPMCSGKVGCFKCLLPPLDESMVCHHTLNSDFAINENCDDPEAAVENGRFVRYVYNGKIRYFEEFKK